jgi:hypothetical protein
MIYGIIPVFNNCIQELSLKVLKIFEESLTFLIITFFQNFSIESFI